MKMLLEHLWDSYQQQQPKKEFETRERLFEERDGYEKQLLSNMTEEQKELFKQYAQCVEQIQCFSEKAAYVEGISFGVTFLVEGLYKDHE